MEAEHARCQELQVARDRDGQLAGHMPGGDLAEAMKKLSKSERVHILGVMAEGKQPFEYGELINPACDPSDITAQIAALEKYKRSRSDILGRIGARLAVQVMGNLGVDDILSLRLASPH